MTDGNPNYLEGVFALKEPVEQPEPPMWGNYKPDPQYKKLYVVIASQAYDPALRLLTAVASESDATKLGQHAEAALDRYNTGCEVLSDLGLLDLGNKSKLLSKLETELGERGLEKALEVACPAYLHFEVQEVTAKVN